MVKAYNFLCEVICIIMLLPYFFDEAEGNNHLSCCRDCGVWVVNGVVHVWSMQLGIVQHLMDLRGSHVRVQF